MFVISHQQMRSMGAFTEERFRQELLAHLAEYFPMRLALGGRSGLEDLARLAVERGSAHGLKSEAALLAFAGQMAVAGVAFDEDPIFAEICDPLSDAAMGDDVLRSDAVDDALWDFVEQAYGADAENSTLR